MNTKTSLTFTTALAAALLATGCNRQPDWNDNNQAAICTDRSGHRVADSQCDRYAGGGGGGGVSPFLWYYMGRSSAIPPIGGYAGGGGSYSRGAGTSYSRAPSGGMESVASHASVTRGGFGSSAHSYGGFGGE